MSQDSVVRARIDERTKKKAAAIFAKHGLTLSDGIRMMLILAARNETIPISFDVPNKTTTKAIQSKKLKRAQNSKELLKQLNA